MIRHRFVNAGLSPIPMGATAEYACICGKRGTHAVIARHIAEASLTGLTDDEITPTPITPIDYAAIVIDPNTSDFGGDTKAHYLPVAPRGPAPLDSDDDATIPPPPATLTNKKSPPIAELFQDMLRTAFQAGVTAAASGETFEIWYQREVLQ